MVIRELKLDRFRNLLNGTLEFCPTGNLVIGDNGQGKTNLLEAIYYLTLLKSFRSANDSECIRFGESYFNVRGGWEDDDGRVESASVGYDGRRKKVVISGEEKKRLSEAFGIFKSVLVTPDHIAIVQEGPAARRRYLDIVLSILSPAYLERFKRYRRALASRNTLLREHSAPAAAIEPWEREMAQSGAFLVERRREFVEKIAPEYEKLYSRLSPGESSTIRYISDLLQDDNGRGPESTRITQRFLDRLNQRRSQERERGITLSGPQMDELLFEHGGRPLRNYGSQGQQRTAVICLKMAEAALIRREQDVKPVLLLDDIFSELDPVRSGFLLEELVERHQSFITAPRSEAIFARLGHLPALKISAGAITKF